MKKGLSLLAAALALLSAISWAGVYYSTPGTANAESFTVAKGQSVDDIVGDLKAHGIVRSGLLFKYALSRSGKATRLQPGTYDLRGLSTYEDVIEALTTGGIAASESVLLVKEGWDLFDIKEELTKVGYARAEDLFDVTGVPAADHRQLSSDQAPKPADFSADLPFLKEKPAYVSLEGYLFPDTYRIFKDATPEEVVKTLLKNFDRKLTPELRERATAGRRTLYEVVTMASVVEREVRTDEDRRKVADIFWRRLEAGIALQADSTVNYVTRKGRAAVSLDDTRVDSGYNTYKYPGLPLGPICNPGLSAIVAAIDPSPNDNWYFLTDKEGNVHYAKTLDEHNKNKVKYLK